MVLGYTFTWAKPHLNSSRTLVLPEISHGCFLLCWDSVFVPSLWIRHKLHQPRWGVIACQMNRDSFQQDCTYMYILIYHSWYIIITKKHQLINLLTRGFCLTLYAIIRREKGHLYLQMPLYSWFTTAEFESIRNMLPILTITKGGILQNLFQQVQYVSCHSWIWGRGH